MSSALLVGQPNVGKTTFALNFAEFLGLHRLMLTIRQPEGFSSTLSYYIDEAREKLVSHKPHETKNLQSISLSLPKGKRRRTFALFDTCGLSDGIDPREEIRKAMSQTIRLIDACELIFHLLDLTMVKSKAYEREMIDDQIHAYASLRPVYCLLANKVDLLGSRQNLSLLRERYPDSMVIPISAKFKEGFKDVKIFLMKNL